MNHIAGRTKDFKQIKRTMQRQSGDSFDYWGEKEKFYTECQRAALYRIYLFSCLKRDEYLIKRTEKLIQLLPKGTETKNRAETELLALTPELQDLIIIAEEKLSKTMIKLDLQIFQTIKIEKSIL